MKEYLKLSIIFWGLTLNLSFFFNREPILSRNLLKKTQFIQNCRKFVMWTGWIEELFKLKMSNRIIYTDVSVKFTFDVHFSVKIHTTQGEKISALRINSEIVNKRTIINEIRRKRSINCTKMTLTRFTNWFFTGSSI